MMVNDSEGAKGEGEKTIIMIIVMIIIRMSRTMNPNFTLALSFCQFQLERLLCLKTSKGRTAIQ